VPALMAMELHRLTVGAEVVAIVAREQNRASKGLPESQRPQSLKAERHPLASLAIIKERAWIWNLPWWFAVEELPSQESRQRWQFAGGGLNLCRFLGGTIVRKEQEDCSIPKRKFVHPVLRRTG
jgi:hypothetical protein